MNWCKKIIAMVVLLGAVLTIQAAEIDVTNPYKMMNGVAQQSFDRLKAEKDNIAKDPNLLKQLVEQELMPHVNYQYAALKLLGPNLRGANKAEVHQFIDAFRGYLVTSYAQVLTQYTDQKVQFESEKSVAEGQNIVSIRVEILDNSRPNIKLDFTLIQNKKTGEWQAYDMVAEGISLLSSKQSEWNTKIRQQGIAAVSKELTELAQKPIVFEGKK